MEYKAQRAYLTGTIDVATLRYLMRLFGLETGLYCVPYWAGLTLTR